MSKEDAIKLADRMYYKYNRNYIVALCPCGSYDIFDDVLSRLKNDEGYRIIYSTNKLNKFIK